MASAIEPPFETLMSVFVAPLRAGDAASLLAALVRTRSAHDLGAAGFEAVVVDSAVSTSDGEAAGEDCWGDATKVSELRALSDLGGVAADLASDSPSFSSSGGDNITEGFLAAGTATFGVMGMIGTTGRVAVRVWVGEEPGRLADKGVVGGSPEPTSLGA
jgi:hypothetical protein